MKCEKYTRAIEEYIALEKEGHIHSDQAQLLCDNAYGLMIDPDRDPSVERTLNDLDLDSC